MKKSTTLPKLLEKTQKVFNAYIRERDKELGCISCGAEVEQAGHYHSQGHHSALRFNPINTNGQCRRCNMFLHGNLIKYRQGLVDRYGEMVVLDLEDSANKNRLKKWSRDELEQLISQYK
jgi:hypothetical protein